MRPHKKYYRPRPQPKSCPRPLPFEKKAVTPRDGLPHLSLNTALLHIFFNGIQWRFEKRQIFEVLFRQLERVGEIETVT